MRPKQWQHDPNGHEADTGIRDKVGNSPATVVSRRVSASRFAQQCLRFVQSSATLSEKRYALGCEPIGRSRLTLHQLRVTLADQRFQTVLLSSLAALALLLAAVGIYGLIANSVVERTTRAVLVASCSNGMTSSLIWKAR